jgi:hypothetical protein
MQSTEITYAYSEHHTKYIAREITIIQSSTFLHGFELKFSCLSTKNYTDHQTKYGV